MQWTGVEEILKVLFMLRWPCVIDGTLKSKTEHTNCWNQCSKDYIRKTALCEDLLSDPCVCRLFFQPEL